MICPACDTEMTPAVDGWGLHPTCDPLPIDPEHVMAEVFSTIRDGIINQPRSLQTRIGPSEIAHPCARRLGYKLAGIPEVNGEATRGVAWKPFVGTGIHEQMASIMAAHEIARFTDGDPSPRWHVEEQVTVGDIDGVPITGKTDLYDGWTGLVLDWKFTTKSLIRDKFKPHGPGRQYRGQAHLYGRGWQRAGHPVRHVGIVFMTRDGEYSDRYFWHEPYDEQIAVDELERVGNIQRMLGGLGPDTVLPLLPAESAFCGHCPWNDIHATDLTVACPGVNKDGSDMELMDHLFPPKTPAST